MKKPLGAVLGLTAACAACCAILLAVPTILAVAGITSAWLGAHVVGTAIAATAALLFGVALWQRARSKSAAAKKDCGCDVSCEAGGRP